MEIEFISNEGFVGQTQKQELDPEVQRGFFSDFICLLCSKERSRLLYTSCSHKLCENCKIDLFKAKQEQTINCPFCSEPLRKRDISEKSQEEQDFENEIRIREMLLLEFVSKFWLIFRFSEQREDFETEEQYNDYLELFEEVVLKKLRGDLQSLDEDIKEYRKMKTLRKRLRKDREKALANKGVSNSIEYLTVYSYSYQSG